MCENGAQTNRNRFSSLPSKLQCWWAWLQSYHRKCQDWRSGIIVCATATSVIALVNIPLLIIALAKFDPETAIGNIFTGDCNVVKKVNSALHLLINILSTTLLSASSYTMQCLNSPTRHDIDRAHKQGTSLHVGIPSFRNLFHIEKKKMLLWWALCLSTLPLHLFFNSIIFPTTSANEFAMLIVEKSLFSGNPFLNRDEYYYLSLDNSTGQLRSKLDNIQKSYQAGNFTGPHAPADCISMYGQQFLTGRRSLLAVTTPVLNFTRMAPGLAFTDEWPFNDDIHSSGSSTPGRPLWNGSSLVAFQFGSSLLTSYGADIFLDQQWLCSGYDDSYRMNSTGGSCTPAMAQRFLKKNGTWYLRPKDLAFWQTELKYPIEYCLSEENVSQHCTLQYIPTFLGIVVVCNVVKVFCMFTAEKYLPRRSSRILATVGDAVASFLGRPDIHTENSCLLNFSDHYKSAHRRSQKTFTFLPLTYGVAKRKFTYLATSKIFWFTTMSICSLFLLLGVILLRLSIQSLRRNHHSMHQIWNLGLGKPNTGALLGETLGLSGSTASGIFKEILVINSFQLALSATYFLYNSVFTAQCSAVEWSLFASEYRSLRVTRPRGKQISSWFLHLPLTFGIPLTISMMILHFLVSQSIFLVRIQWYDLDGNRDPENFIMDVGYSPLGILCSVCVGAALILAQCLHALRPLNARIPIHGNQSMIISAACHPLAGERDKYRRLNDSIAKRPLKWGAVTQPEIDEDPDAVGHCSLTAEPVELPVPGYKYA